jgi:arginine decarboxylase
LCPTLDSFDIGGGFPIRTTLGFNYNYQNMADEIVLKIKTICNDQNIEEPNIFTEFGSFTVGESGATLYTVTDVKKQNDNELWYMIDSSFITTLPDTWGIKQKFILLALNHWDKDIQPANLGGLSCDGDDYYNGETHLNQVYLPTIKNNNTDQPLVVGFFHTGAYQEAIGGYGGIQHCLIPAPKHIIIDKGENGEIKTHVFAEEQNVEPMLKTLGY